MSVIKTFEKYTSDSKSVGILAALKDVKEAINKADNKELEKARYIVADIKSKIEAKLNKEDKD